MMTCYSSIALLMLCFCGVSLIEAQGNGFNVELIHRDSLKSPFHRHAETHFQRVSEAVRRSFRRANRLKKYSTYTNSPESNLIPGDGDYLMSYSLGTPPFQIYGAIDTGSQMIWTQCHPCKSCYNQTRPIFNSLKSKTYQNLACSSTKCNFVDEPSCSSSNTCRYKAGYADQSKSIGDVGLETLTLKSTSGSHISFPRIMIGCGHENTGLYDRRSSGMVGLGPGPASLITQLGSSIKWKFSYCLMPVPSPSKNVSSKLYFGDAAVVSGHGVVSTPLIQTTDPGLYMLTLEALSVGNKRIYFGASYVGSIQPVNIVMDSGTALNFLQDDIYNKLESTVAEVINLKRVKSPIESMNLCYASTIVPPNLPLITAHFRGANVTLPSSNTFTQVSESVLCLAFTSSGPSTGNNGFNLFGISLQWNFLIGYDLQKKIVSFKPTDCSKL